MSIPRLPEAPRGLPRRPVRLHRHSLFWHPLVISAVLIAISATFFAFAASRRGRSSASVSQPATACQPQGSELPTPPAPQEKSAPPTVQGKEAPIPAPFPKSILYWANLAESEREAQFDSTLRLMNSDPSKRGRVPTYLAPAIYWLSRDPTKRRAALAVYQHLKDREAEANRFSAESALSELADDQRRADEARDRGEALHPLDRPSGRLRVRSYSSNTITQWREMFRKQLGSKEGLLNPY